MPPQKRGKQSVRKGPRRPAAKGAARPARRRSAVRRRRRQQHAWLGPILNGAGIAVAVSVVTFVFGIGMMAAGLPSSDEYLSVKGTPSVSIVDATGRLIARRGVGQGEWVPLSALPPAMPKAVIAIEDRRFYDHWGVDPIAVARALAVNLGAGRVVQGGSTITQQLAKNLFLESDRTFWRKGQEMLLAIYLEMRFSKDEILAMYLNRAYFGAGAFGIDAAARRYFAKPASDLTLSEAAILAGLLKAPSRFAPTRDFEAAEARGKVVLAAMQEVGAISAEEEARALATRPKLARALGSDEAMYFVDWVMDEIPDHIGGLNQDIRVETTLNLDLQRAAERAVAAMIDKHAFTKNVSEAGLIALENDGAVVAMVGGRSYTISQFNHATQARRQPGSAFKPFVYLTAIENGRTPRSIVLDSPLVVSGWNPSNFDDEYEGEVTFTRALSASLNTAAVRVLMDQGPRQVAAMARRLGIASDLRTNATLALGTSEVTLSELTSAYLPFANGGHVAAPHAIKRILTSSGRILYEHPAGEGSLVISPRSAAAMNEMLFETTRTGTARGARLPDRDVAGKTGTSQNFRDAWFVGYTNGIATGVWVGNDDNAAMKNVTGGSLPVEAWRDFMETASRTYEPRPLAGVSDRDPTPGFEISAESGVTMVQGESDEDANAFDEMFERLFGPGEPPSVTGAVAVQGHAPRTGPPGKH
ncbi:MAG: PBP1A family penicillin-binding protein [Alphaproteobacteria bacterium]|nr:PBP1A family penicillin-binding protein [Alphaproteobacteria bacterium]